MPVVEIPDEALLWRRVSHQMVKSCGTPQSNAFRDNVDNKLSVHLATLANLQDFRERFPGHGLAQIAASDARLEGLEVRHDPTEADPSHTVIMPSPDKKEARRLAKKSVWVIPPPAC